MHAMRGAPPALTAAVRESLRRHAVGAPSSDYELIWHRDHPGWVVAVSPAHETYKCLRPPRAITSAGAACASASCADVFAGPCSNMSGRPWFTSSREAARRWFVGWAALAGCGQGGVCVEGTYLTATLSANGFKFEGVEYRFQKMCGDRPETPPSPLSDGYVTPEPTGSSSSEEDF